MYNKHFTACETPSVMRAPKFSHDPFISHAFHTCFTWFSRMLHMVFTHASHGFHTHFTFFHTCFTWFSHMLPMVFTHASHGFHTHFTSFHTCFTWFSHTYPYSDEPQVIVSTAVLSSPKLSRDSVTLTLWQLGKKVFYFLYKISTEKVFCFHRVMVNEQVL